MKKGVQDIIVTLFSRGLAMTMSLGTQCALAWLLGKEGRGQYAICLVFTSLSAVILTFGMDWAANYSVASKKVTLNESFSFSLSYVFIVCLIGCPLAYMLTLLPIEFFQKAPPQAFRLSVFWIAALMWFNFNSAHLRGLRKFNLLAAATITQSLFILVGTIVGVKVLNMGVLSPIAAGIAGSILFCVVTLIWLRQEFGLSWAFPAWQKVREELHYGMRTFWGTFGMLANAQIGTILLAFFVAEGQLGIFAVAMGFLAQIITLSDVVGSVVQPRVSADEKGRPELVTLCSRMVVALAFMACLFVLVFSRPLVATLFSKEFLPVIPLLFVMTPGIIIRCAGKSLFPYFNGINRPGIVSVATILNLIINMILLVVLVPRFELTGAAFATTGGYVVSTIFLLITFTRRSGFTLWSAFLLRWSDVKILKGIIFKKKALVEI